MRTIRIGSFLLTTALLFGPVGCAEKSGVHEETKVTTPEGSKKITRDTKVESTGDMSPTTNPGTTSPSAPNP